MAALLGIPATGALQITEIEIEIEIGLKRPGHTFEDAVNGPMIVRSWKSIKMDGR